MTKTKNYILKMSKAGGAQTEIAANPLEPEIMETITRIGKAFTIAEYRGNVQFFIWYDGAVRRATDVTYTDDAPKGIWRT